MENKAFSVSFIKHLKNLRTSINNSIGLIAVVFVATMGLFYSLYIYDANNVWAALLFTASTSILTAYIFYVVVVYLPDRKRKKAIKTSFKYHFSDFKRIAIGMFIGAVEGAYSEEDVEPLFDIKKFKEYFKEQVGEGQTRWDVVATKIDNDETFRDDLLVEMEILRSEILFVLNNVYIDDENVYSFLKDFSTIIYRNREISYDDREAKALCQMLWQMFSGWSWNKGYSEEDVFQLVLDRI